MSIEELKEQSFPTRSADDWKGTAEASLKGKSIDSLKSHTYENITLKPLYSKNDEKIVPGYPGGSDFRRGIAPLGYVTDNWKIAQLISYNTLEELKQKLHESFGRGQTAISFKVSNQLFEKNNSLLDVLAEFGEKFPFSINAKDFQATFLTELTRITEKQGNGDKITGYIGNDPISLFVEEGLLSNVYLAEWSKAVKQAGEKLPNLRTVLINTTTYHQGGANAVQELGIAAAAGVFYLQQFLDDGMKLGEILSKIIFNFSIGGNFFMEMAKLRAARILWNKITEVYGADVESRGMQIAAETSIFTKTVKDPQVNILRAGNEAFSAVLGGVQYLHVTPYDELTGSTNLSERIARNTQNILKEEAHLQKIIDPAGGSWYVEALTTELAEKAWEYFKMIEGNGGILEVLKSSWLQNDIKAVNEKRKHDIYTRKQSIVGTNVYANLDEAAVPVKEQQHDKSFLNNSSSIKIEVITNTRLSEPFEELRVRCETLEDRTAFKPQVGMICLGKLKQYKARLDFMRGFISAGGLKAVESGPVTSYEAAKQFVSNLNTKYFCLCSSNEQYELLGHEILSGLKKEFSDRIFYFAGLPDNDLQLQWINEGVKQFIHFKSNCYETLSEILTEMEVAVNEVTKA